MALFRRQDDGYYGPSDGATLRFARGQRNPYTLRFADGFSVTFSPDNRYVATFTVRETKIWETETGRLVYRASSDAYTDEGRWKVEWWHPVRFVNEVTVIDGGRTLIDLENNIGIPVMEDQEGDAHLLPLDGEHFFQVHQDRIALVNRDAKLTLWTFDLKKERGRERYPHLETGSLRLHPETNRLFFLWGENARGRKGNGQPWGCRIGSLAMDGMDFRTEFSSDADNKNQTPVIALSPSGQSVVRVTDWPNHYVPPQLIHLRDKKRYTLEFPRIKLGFSDSNEYMNGFLPPRAGEIAEFVQQRRDGTLEYSHWDATTGKTVRRYRVVEEKDTRPMPVAWSRDYRLAAVMRQAADKMFWTVSLHDASGRLLCELDDTRQTIAFDQRQSALIQRAKEREDAERQAWSEYLRREAAKDRALREKEAAARAERDKKAREREEADARLYKTCARCNGTGTYSAITKTTRTEDDGYANSYTQYDVYGNSRQVYQFGVKKTRRVTTEGRVSYACPYCSGRGKVSR